MKEVALYKGSLPRTLSLETVGESLVFNYVDQRFLPGELRVVGAVSADEVIESIKVLAVRGAPAIGVAGMAALALWAWGKRDRDGGAAYEQALRAAAAQIASARPTAVNLRWGVERAYAQALLTLSEGGGPDAVSDALYAFCKAAEAADEATNRKIGEVGAALLGAGSRILTHCNAGSLATVFYGTALGVIYSAAEQGKIAHVYADETRPVGQGSRLTVWELARAGVPVTLLCDNMAADLMSRGAVDAVIVGADRIAANGDTANKIGTLGLSVLAKNFGVPFYIAAPTSTFDASTVSGSAIKIEQRDPAEVLKHPIHGVEVYNPAFDVTPAENITGYITELGLYTPQTIDALFSQIS